MHVGVQANCMVSSFSDEFLMYMVA